jgi:hypothetical protein
LTLYLIIQFSKIADANLTMKKPLARLKHSPTWTKSIQPPECFKLSLFCICI